MRADCKRLAKCGKAGYTFCRTVCGKRKSGCEHIGSKKSKEPTKEERKHKTKKLIEQYEKAQSRIKHKSFDCNNPPPYDELIPEQIRALENWKEDTKGK
jgi:hypothetical protein